jgi:hypothetical protein
MNSPPGMAFGEDGVGIDGWRASQGGTPILRREFSSKSSLGVPIAQQATMAAALSATRKSILIISTK